MFIKKVCAVILSILILTTSVTYKVNAEETENKNSNLPEFSDTLPAKSYLLMESSTGQVLAENNADEKMPPASITKIMTMLLLMERIESNEIKMDDIVTTSEHANSMGGTQIWLEVGEQMSVRDLLKAMAVNSANDASVAIAEHIAGTEENFVKLMNKKAQELKMTNTTFKNATGLDADGHLSTARDIAIMSKELLKYPQITEFTSIYMDSLRDGKTELVNTNKMVRFYDGCKGLKTGTTDGAGSCLSSVATREGMTLIAVSMGSTTSKERFDSCRSLLNFGFSSYILKTPDIEDDALQNIKVERGQKSTLAIKTGENSASILVPKGKNSQLQSDCKIEEKVEAPIEEGQKVGEITYTLNGEMVAKQDIVAAESVKKLDFLFAFCGLFKNLIGIRG